MRHRQRKGVDDESRPRPKPRRRPGRLRRWLLRPAAWTLLAVLICCAAVPLALRTEAVRSRLATLAEEQVGRLLDRRIEVGSVSVRLLPLTVELTDVVVGGPAADDPPFAEVDHLLLEADVGTLGDPVLTFRQVRATRPRIYLDFRANGDNNIPKVGRRGADRQKQRDLAVVIQYVAVEEGVYTVSQERLPLDFEARDLQARFSGGGGLELQGSVTAREVEVTLPRARPVLAAVGLKGRFIPGRFEIDRARVNGPDLQAAVTGTIRWREVKEARFQFDAEGHSEFFRRAGYLRDQMTGPFDFDGEFVWRPGDWSFGGEVASGGLTVFERDLTSVRGEVAGDRERVRVDVARADYGGGGLSGAVTFERAGDRPVEVDLLLDRVGLQQILDDQRLPVSGLAGVVSGPFRYRFPFTESRTGQGAAELRIDPTARRQASDVPVRGTVPLRIEEGVFRTGAALLEATDQRVLGEGAYDLARRSGEFEYRIDGRRLEELLHLLPALRPAGPEPSPWLPTSARGNVEGTLFLAPGGARTRIRLALVDVTAPGASADRAQGTMEIGADGLSELRLELLRPEGALIVTGSVPFGEGEATAEAPVGGLPPFALAVDAAGWPVDQARPWMPFEIPFDGRMSGGLSLGGSPAALEGALDLRVEPVTVRGVEADYLELDLTFDPAEIAFRRATLASAAGTLTATGAFDPVGERAEIDLGPNTLDLGTAPFSTLAPGIAGQVTVAGRLEGELREPTLDAELAWTGVTTAVEEAPDGAPDAGRNGTTRVRWADSQLAVEGSLAGLVEVDGGGRLDDRGFELEIAVETDDLPALGRLAGVEKLPDFTGRFEGALALAGDLASESSWETALRLDLLTADFAGHRLDNLEPVVLRLEPGQLVVDSLFLGEEATASDLFVAGTIAFEEDYPLDLNLQSSLSIGWFDLLWPGLGLQDGRFEVLASVAGPASRPRINGQGEITGARLLVPQLPTSIREVDGLLLFYPDQIVVDHLRGEAAGGELRASGSLDPYAGGEAGGQEVSYRFQASGQGLELRYPEGWLLRGDANVQVASVPDGRQIQGSVALDRALYLDDVKLGLTQLLQGFFARRRVEVETADELLSTTQLNVAVKGPGALRVRNNVADFRGDLDFVVRGSLARPVLFGRVGIEQEGTLVYGGNEYEIERGQLTFANPFRIEPVIDLVATTDVREYDVTLNLAGTFERLNATFASDPPLADLEVLSLLTTGEQPVGSTVGRTADTADGVGAERLLYGQASTLIADRVNRLFGLDKFRIDPLTGATGNISSARVTVGKRLSRDLFATYSYDPSVTEQQILQLEWQVSRGLVLVLTQNGDDTYAVDARLEKSF